MSGSGRVSFGFTAKVRLRVSVGVRCVGLPGKLPDHTREEYGGVEGEG